MTDEEQFVKVVAEDEGRIGSTEKPGVTTSSFVGQQSIEYADTLIKVETAEHKRQIEKQKLDHQLEQERQDNRLRRFREKTTFIVVVVVLVALLGSSFWVAATASDPTRQTWAQAIVTVLASAIGGAFAGYAAAKR
jgi:cation transport ATPase